MPYVRSPKDQATGAYIQAAPARVCEFSSDTQCMSVICRVFKEHAHSGEFSAPECVIYSKARINYLLEILSRLLQGPKGITQ